MSILYVAPLGAVDEEALGAIEMCLWQTFGGDVKRLLSFPDPSYAFDPKRGQWNSTMIVREMMKDAPDNALRILGVTEKDLFIPMLSFVFGQAQVNGKCAVVSLARLRQEFYGIPPNRLLILARSVKEATHEMGHTFGLTHCLDSTCPMSLSNTIQQVDYKGDDLCKNCSITLEENLKSLLGQSKKPQLREGQS